MVAAAAPSSVDLPLYAPQTLEQLQDPVYAWAFRMRERQLLQQSELAGVRLDFEEHFDDLAAHPWTDDGTTLTPRVAGRVPSSPSGPTGSEQWGEGADAGTHAVNHIHNTLIGYNTSVGPGTAAARYNVVIGSNAYARAESVAIGASANVNGSGSVGIGYNISVGNNDCVVIGDAASAGATAHIVIGADASTSAHGSEIAIGTNATCSNAFTIALGPNTTADARGIGIGYAAKAAAESVVIGYNANGTGRSSVVVIGRQPTISDHYCVGIGYGVNCYRGVCIGYQADNTGGIYSIAIGYQATTTAANQMMIGSANGPITALVLGNGDTSATPSDPTIRGTDGVGTNIEGAILTIASGRGTGNATGGDILLRQSEAGASGTGLRSLTDRLLIDADAGIVLTPQNGGVYMGKETSTLRLGPVTTAATLQITDDGGSNVIAEFEWDTVDAKWAMFGATPVAQQSALTAADGSTVDSTYGDEERDVIQNLVTRQNELESILSAYGLLP